MSRSFQPVILYKDECRFELPVEKKEQIHDMLRMNGRLWTILLSSHKTAIPTTSPNNTPLELEDDEDELPLDCYSTPFKKTRKGSSSPALSSSASSPPSSPSSLSSSSTTTTTTTTTARKRRGNLPKAVTDHLKRYLVEHKQHPYPTDEEKLYLQQETQLTINQISNWFINARRRLLPFLQTEAHRICLEPSSRKEGTGKKKQDLKKQHGINAVNKKSSSVIKKSSPPARSRPKRSCRQQHASPSPLLNADEWLE